MKPSCFHISTFLSLFGFNTIILNPSVHGEDTKIDSALQNKIDAAPAGSTWNVIVIFKKDRKLHSSIHASISNIEEPHIKAYESLIQLEKSANESQRSVVDSIRNFQEGRQSKSGKVRLKTLWDHNDLLIDSASKELINMLGEGSKPECANITKIVEDVPFPFDTGEVWDETAKLPHTISSSKVQKTAGSKEWIKEAWGLERINAPAWWDANYNGTGVIVGHIDTGVDVRHPSLKWSWIGKGEGWLDPGEPSNTFPFEVKKDTSHGTHTMGTLIGRGRGSSSANESDVSFFGVGVAPGARWISCTGCQETTIFRIVMCRSALIRTCMMFMHCPNTENKCIYKPDVVATILGCVQTETERCPYYQEEPYDEMMNLWKAVGIIPVFAAGNKGRCGSISDPADREDVITVGNVNEQDRLHSDSSMGPPLWRYNSSEVTARQIFKPTLVAPGTNVFSTFYTGTQGEFKYGYKTGTSMATPHVAGAIALLLSRTERLTYEAVRAILLNSTVPNTLLTVPYIGGRKCGEKNDTDLQNHKFGWGRLLLPDPNDKNLPKPKTPTRKMPPPPDYTDLGDDANTVHGAASMISVLNALVILHKYAIMEM